MIFGGSVKKTNTEKKKKINKFKFFCLLVVFVFFVAYVMFEII